MLVAFSTRRQRRPSLLTCARHCPATRRVILRRGDARRAFLARLFGWFRRRLIRRREFCGRSRHRHHPLFPHLRQEFSLCQCRVLFLCRLESVEQFQALCGLRLGEAGHFHVPAVYLPPVLRGEFQSLAGSGNLKSPPVLAIAAQPAVQQGKRTLPRGAAPRLSRPLAVAQTSKSAVPPISKSARCAKSSPVRAWKPAAQQTWKSALQKLICTQIRCLARKLLALHGKGCKMGAPVNNRDASVAQLARAADS